MIVVAVRNYLQLSYIYIVFLIFNGITLLLFLLYKKRRSLYPLEHARSDSDAGQDKNAE